jgi:hypothetical protein
LTIRGEQFFKILFDFALKLIYKPLIFLKKREEISPKFLWLLILNLVGNLLAKLKGGFFLLELWNDASEKVDGLRQAWVKQASK